MLLQLRDRVGVPLCKSRTFPGAACALQLRSLMMKALRLALACVLSLGVIVGLVLFARWLF